jgi:hypothetical protein
MGFSFTYQGASGENYTFILTDIRTSNSLSHQGGIFALGKNAPEPLFFGEAEKLATDVPACKHWHSDGMDGATHFHYLIEPNAERRREILDDLLEICRPPLNRPE